MESTKYLDEDRECNGQRTAVRIRGQINKLKLITQLMHFTVQPLLLNISSLFSYFLLRLRQTNDGGKQKASRHNKIWMELRQKMTITLCGEEITNKNKFTVQARYKMRKLKYSFGPVITGTMGTMNYH